jgi:Ribonuclease G/E
MTRKRIGEGLLVSFTSPCPTCDGRGVVFDRDLLD